MRLGVAIGESDIFVRELLEDFSYRYDVRLFERRTWNLPILHTRINRTLLHRGLQSFIQANDVMFFEWAGDLLVAASRLPKQNPVVARLHSYELFDWAPRVNWDYVDRIILVSNAMQQHFASLYPEHADKTRVVYHGKCLDTFKPAPVPRAFTGNLGMLCRLVPIKRVYEVVLAVHELKKRGYYVQLHLGGEPEQGANHERYFVSLNRIVEKLGLQDQVVFHGNVDDVVSWLQTIDIFISNSYWEGQQNALLEAMATGCYSLSHFWDGAEEVLPEENLYTTDIELCDKIIAYYEQPEQEKQCHRARMRAIACEKFDFQHHKKQIADIIQDAVGRDA